MNELRIRPYCQADLSKTVQLWHETKRVAYPYLPSEQGRSLAEDTAFFAGAILPRCAVWLACSVDGSILGFLAINGSYLDRLYVCPRRQRMGVGSALLEQAKRLSPDRLELHTHQENHPARAFYRRHGFEEVELGLSPPPECAPDVRCLWINPEER